MCIIFDSQIQVVLKRDILDQLNLQTKIKLFQELEIIIFILYIIVSKALQN